MLRKKHLTPFNTIFVYIIRLTNFDISDISYQRLYVKFRFIAVGLIILIS